MAGSSTINGQEYDWSGISIQMLGNTKPLLGITDISWSSEADNQWHFGAGRHAVAYTQGPKKYSGSLKFHKGEVASMEKALPPNVDLLDLQPFEIVISYRAGVKVTTKILQGVLLTKQDESNNTGSRILENSISFTFQSIK